MKAIVLTILWALVPVAFSQIIYENKEPLSWQSPKSLSISTEAIYQLKSFDNQQLREQALLQPKNTPLKIATAVNVSLSPENSGAWSTSNLGEKIWRLQVQSPGATHLSLVFSEFKLNPGEQVYIYTPDREHILGPLTHHNNKAWSSLPVMPLTSDKIIIEYNVGPQSSKPGNLKIGKISHGFSSVGSSLFGDSGGCNNNVICPDWSDWGCNMHSSVLIFLNSENTCSGTLLNNTAEDGKPIISTANHCLISPTKDWLFVFNWMSPTCASSTNFSQAKSVAGATKLANHETSDFALLEMSEKPPVEYGVYYAGWDATGTVPQSQTGIHHPSGDIMKISQDTDPAGKTTWNSIDVWKVIWNDGTTEPGSSGSALYDQNFRLIGQLGGGDASCSVQEGPDHYGRLEISWNLGASGILDPGNTGKKVLDGMSPAGTCTGLGSVASFAVSEELSCTGEIAFTDKSIAATSWQWDFGDGHTSTEQNPTHTYSQGGSYTVSLTTSSGNEDTSTEAKTVLINPTAEFFPYQNCEASALSLNAIPAEGLSIEWFENATSTTPLHTGIPFTPSTTGTYYAQAKSSSTLYNIGLTENTGNVYYVSSYNYGPYIEVHAPTLWKSFVVFSSNSGKLIVEIQNLATGTSEKQNFDVKEGEQRFEINHEFAPGNYRVRTGEGTEVSLSVTSTGEFPFTAPGLITLIGGGAGNDQYEIFYDWEVSEPTCSTERIAVQVNTLEECLLPISNESALPPTPSIFFTPDKNQLQIYTLQPSVFQIMNLQGRVVYSKTMQKGQHLLTVPPQVKGLHLAGFKHSPPSNRLFIF